MGQHDSEQTVGDDGGVSLREAARLLGCSVDTVQRRLRSGRLRGEKRVRPNGTEEWAVYLPADVAPLRAKRPADPSDLVFPGPPDQRDLEVARLERIVAFLTAELEARRAEVAEAQRQAAIVIERERRREQLMLSAPSLGWWDRLGRALGLTDRGSTRDGST